MFGGTIGDQLSYLYDFWKYDMIENKFTFIQYIPGLPGDVNLYLGIVNSCMVANNGIIYILGGVTRSDPSGILFFIYEPKHLIFNFLTFFNNDEVSQT